MTLEEINKVLSGPEIESKEDLFLLEKSLSKEARIYVEDNGLTNLYIACEEIAELQQAITKMIRTKGDKRFVAEEMADVYLGMRFINDIYKVNISVDAPITSFADREDFENTYKNKYNITEILQILNRFQNSILKSLLKLDIKNLKKNGDKVLDALETLKLMYDINDADILKIRKYKIDRLRNRIDSKTQV